MDYTHLDIWDEVLEMIFDDFSYLLNEDGVRIISDREMTGPGGDWDIFTLSIEGVESEERQMLMSAKSTPGGYSGPDVDFDDFAEELAYHIVDDRGGEVEEDGSTFTIWF